MFNQISSFSYILFPSQLFKNDFIAHVPLSPSSRPIIWYRSRGGDAVGNRRSDVALAMRQRLQSFIHLQAHGLRKGDEHPAYTPHGVWHSFLVSVRNTSVFCSCISWRYLHYARNLCLYSHDPCYTLPTEKQSVPRVIINDTIHLFFKTAVSIF